MAKCRHFHGPVDPHNLIYRVHLLSSRPSYQYTLFSLCTTYLFRLHGHGSLP